MAIAVAAQSCKEKIMSLPGIGAMLAGLNETLDRLIAEQARAAAAAQPRATTLAGQQAQGAAAAQPLTVAAGGPPAQPPNNRVSSAVEQCILQYAPLRANTNEVGVLKREIQKLKGDLDTEMQSRIGRVTEEGKAAWKNLRNEQDGKVSELRTRCENSLALAESVVCYEPPSGGEN
jgi:hypothetical protein